MKLNIKKIDDYPVKKNAVLIVKSSESLVNVKLSDIEIAFVKDRLSGGDEIVSVNQFDRWIFVVLLKEEKNKKDSYKALEKARIAGNKISSKMNERKIESAAIIDCDNQPDLIYAFTEGLALSAYRFLKYFSEEKIKDKKLSLNAIEIYSPKLIKKTIDRLMISVESVFQTRDLVNEPVSHLNAQKLAEEAQTAGKLAGFDVELMGLKKIQKLKMGGLLAVNKGSIDPPTFSVLTWKPKNAKNEKPIIIAGKGIVYDTGGLSLKPTPNSMDSMKSDMAGAAVVIGVLRALALLKVPAYVIGLMPATDNRPGGNAYAPGDVIKMHNGMTVEVLNSDAEGRMILADALSYAKEFKPELVIDVATLTGAAASAIGTLGAVYMGSAGKKIMSMMKESGEHVYERVVEFPFWDEYNEQLKSEIADLKNIGGKLAGAITAGKFLEHFTDYPYIHLDIAGPAFLDAADSYRSKGGTGFGVRLLTEFIESYIK